ncbi:sensor histidine kinase [Halobacillus rhizosphaerae]|uniref:sensor histidine kinase n=1 Tax=Halobacillus rhizosphaerae TaxID=3064889 RepID=UPI00398B7EFF
MILRYVRERLSWLLLILSLQALALFIGYIDPTIPFTSVIYYTFLSLLITVLFFFIRYPRETSFYNQMEQRHFDLDLSSLPEGQRPFEKIIEENMTHELVRLKEEASSLHQASEQEKDDLLAWIHEVKTPLTAMHLIIQRLEDAKAKQQLTYEWLRVHLLLDQQLHQKRIPFIENDLYIEKVELEPLIFNEIKTLQSWCMQKGIGFDIVIEEKEVLSDAKWLTFIIRQFLTNAVKYSESTDIEVRTAIRKGHTQLIIQDHGRGIDSKDLPRIFDKGFTSTSDHNDGKATGMGLYLAAKVAASLKIELSMNSVLHEGTTAFLIFPNQNDFVHITSM